MTEAAFARFADPGSQTHLSPLFDDAVGPGEPARFICAWRQRASLRDIRELAETRDAAGLPVVLVLGEVPSPHLARTMHRQLDGVVLEADASAALVRTVEAVLCGQVVMPRAFRTMLDHPPLSPREKQMLAMVLLDMQNAEIARKLHVTESNVKYHLTSAFGKLGVRSRSAAAALILDPDAGLGPGILRITPEAPDAQSA